MNIRALFVLSSCLLLTLSACGNSDDGGSDGAAGATAGSSGAAGSGGAVAGSGGTGGQGGATVADPNGTVTITYNLDGAGVTTMDCTGTNKSLIHHTVANGGSIGISCKNGTGLDTVIIGFVGPAKTGIFNESDVTVVSFLKGQLQINSPSALEAATPPEHTITITTWDATTRHAVGEAHVPSLTSNGNSTSSHTLVVDITFDATLTDAP